MLKIFVALSMLACSVIAPNGPGSQAIAAPPQSNGVPQVNYSNLKDNITDDIRYAETVNEYNKAFPLAKTSPVVVLDVEENRYDFTARVIKEFNKAFDSDDKFKTRDGIHYDVIRRLSEEFGGFWGGLEGLSEKPRQFYIGMDFDRSIRPQYDYILLHRGSVVLYVYNIGTQFAFNSYITQKLNERQAIKGARKSNVVPQVNHWSIKVNNYTDDTEEFNKAFHLAKTSTMEVLDVSQHTNYTDGVINEFNKVFASDEYKSLDGIHHDVIRRLGDKFGGFWGGLVGISEKPRQFYIGVDADKRNEPENYHILLHKGSVVLYVYYFEIKEYRLGPG